MKITILANIRNHREDIEEQKKMWLYNLLHFVGVDVKSLDGMSGYDAIKYLEKKHIRVCDYPGSNALKVEYRKDSSEPFKVIGEWNSPEFKIKTDSNTGEKYYEISIENWTTAEEIMDIE